MPLTLVLGPANSAKAGEVLGAYGGAARGGALLVVPTASDARHYARELAADGVVLGSVLTFAGLVSEIARRAGYDARRCSPLQREIVLQRVVQSSRLTVLAESATALGFAAAAGDLIAELQRSLVTPQRFAQALRAWAAQDARRAAYAEDVAVLYLDYVRELEHLRRVDAELYAWRAIDALRAAPSRWGRDSAFFYGFDELTALERDAVETLSRIAGAQVTVSLTYEPGRVALVARAEGVEELRALAERVLELPALDAHYAPGSRAALHHLERGLFEPEPRRTDPGPAVRLLEAGGERAEAELVAAEVLALLEAGVPGEEIVVVYRSRNRAAPVIDRVFTEYGIAVTSGYEISFAHTAFGRGLLGLARCSLLEDRAGAQDLLDYLRSPGLLERPELADALEADVRRVGLRSAAQVRVHLGWQLAEIDALGTAADPAAELGRQASRLLALPHRGQAPMLGQDEELDARALAALLRALGQIAELGQVASGGELIELIEHLVVRAGNHVPPGSVLLAEPPEIRARRFRAVFLCGLQEGEFPLPATPEPFLSDERRHELAACSGLRLRPHEDALARERYLFYACVSRATEQVIFSYRSSDEEGNLALASPFLADVAELLSEDWPERRRRRLLADVVWSAEIAPTERELARARAAMREPAEATVGEPPDASGAELATTLGAAAMRHVRHRVIVSAGALEAYADCPVKWLVERELQPARFEPEPDPITRGNFMHNSLELLVRRLGGPVTPASLSAAYRILDEIFADPETNVLGGLGPTGPRAHTAVRAAALRAIEADLRRYLAHEAADGCHLEPQGLELRFGFADEEASLPALELSDGPEPVRLRGMIDRVDIDSGRRAIVRDYKSGRTRPEQQGARWRPDRRLQVALYMLAVRELLGLEPVAGLYQPLSGEDLRARGIFLKGAPVGARVVATDGREQAELDEELDDAAGRAVTLASRLRAGELTPCPETCSRDGCTYPGICPAG